MSSEVETSLIKSKDLIRPLPVSSTSDLPVCVAASPAAPFSNAPRSARNDNHMGSIAPEHRADGCAIGASDFQRQRGEIVNAGSDVTQIKRFNDGNAGAG
jgi:hypothetical protein